MADSKLHCPDCDTDVYVGTGGISNLNAHWDSKTCQENKATKAQFLCLVTGHALAADLTPQSTIDMLDIGASYARLSFICCIITYIPYAIT